MSYGANSNVCLCLLKENMLLCMLTDQNNQELRERAVAHILEIRAFKREKVRLEEEGALPKKRGRKPKKLLVRQFQKIKEINLDATSYPDLIDWTLTEDSHEPPLTLNRNISDEDLHKFVGNWNYLELPSIPAHSQSIERMVGIITPVVAQFKTEKSRRAQLFLKLHYNELQAKKAPRSSQSSSQSSNINNSFFV